MSYAGKRKIVTSPGMIIRGKMIVEQVKSREGYAYAIKRSGEAPYTAPSLELGEVTYYPMEKCPWKTATKPAEYSGEEELYRQARDFVFDHLDISKDERYYDLLSAWILADWIPENFNIAPYLHFHGPPNSGKSRGLEVLQSLGYRALLSPSVSPAAIYRTIEFFRPTFLIDEAELYTSKGMDETKREVLSVLNAGYRRGQMVIRADREGETLRLFDVFGPKALASIQDLPATLAGRAIRIPMMRTTRNVKRRIDEEAAQNMRDMLLTYRFNHLLEKPDEGVNPLDIPDGRLIEIFTPLVLVAPSKKVEERLVKLARDIYEEVIEEERTSMEAQVFLSILESMVEGMGELSVNDIAGRYNQDKPKKEQISNTSCGRILKRLGFQKKRMSGTGRTAIVLDKSLIQRLRYRYGVSGQEKIGRYFPENVIKLARLYPAEEGECARCEQRTTLDFQAETEEGLWGRVCVDCASQIKKKDPDVEWLE